jgi:lipid-binding SYLF domain-containing protein
MVALALMVLPLSAARDTKETDRLENCGTVMKEIMDIPDDIPQDLIDKAECVIIYPSVLKAAFVVGGSYGRGAMTCRTGEHFTGPWTARGNAAAGFQADLQPSSSNRPISRCWL